MDRACILFRIVLKTFEVLFADCGCSSPIVVSVRLVLGRLRVPLKVLDAMS